MRLSRCGSQQKRPSRRAGSRQVPFLLFACTPHHITHAHHTEVANTKQCSFKCMRRRARVACGSIVSTQGTFIPGTDTFLPGV